MVFLLFVLVAFLVAAFAYGYPRARLCVYEDYDLVYRDGRCVRR